MRKERKTVFSLNLMGVVKLDTTSWEPRQHFLTFLTGWWIAVGETLQFIVQALFSSRFSFSLRSIPDHTSHSLVFVEFRTFIEIKKSYATT